MQLISAIAVLQHRCLSVSSIVPASAGGNGMWDGRNCGGCLLRLCRDSSHDCQINQETSTRCIFVKHRRLLLSHDKFFRHDQSASNSLFGKLCAPDRWAGSTGVEESVVSLNAIEPPFGWTLNQWRSTSTATDRCRRVTDRTSFNPDLIFTTIPLKPDRGPSSIRATWPTFKYGHGITDRPLFSAHWMAAISSSSTGTGLLPTPTIWITPGVWSTGRRLCGFILQNR